MVQSQHAIQEFKLLGDFVGFVGFVDFLGVAFLLYIKDKNSQIFLYLNIFIFRAGS